MAEKKELTVEQKQMMLRVRRQTAFKVKRKFENAKKERPNLTVEQFVEENQLRSMKGLEPEPWCECHNRNPCPIEKELDR